MQCHRSLKLLRILLYFWIKRTYPGTRSNVSFTKHSLCLLITSHMPLACHSGSSGSARALDVCPQTSHKGPLCHIILAVTFISCFRNEKSDYLESPSTHIHEHEPDMKGYFMFSVDSKPEVSHNAFILNK